MKMINFTSITYISGIRIPKGVIVSQLNLY